MPQTHRKVYPIVGGFYRPPGKMLAEGMPLGQPLILEREPGNPIDPNAVKVMWDPLADPSWQDFQPMKIALEGGGWTPQQVIEFSSGLPIHLGYIPNSPKTGKNYAPGGKIADFLSPGLLSGEVAPLGAYALNLEGGPGIMVSITPQEFPVAQSIEQKDPTGW